MRTRIRTRAATGVISGIVAALLLSVLPPSFASHTETGTKGFVNVHELLAGAVNQPFALTIEHDTGVASSPIPGSPPPTPPITAVRIQSPSGYVINSVTPPAGKNWSVNTLASDLVQLQAAAAADGISAGANQVFSIVATNPSNKLPLADKTGAFNVFVMDSANVSRKVQNKDATNTLGLTTRVLKADLLRISAPGPSGGMAGATDGSATVGQPGITITGRIQNVGGGVQNVTASLTAASSGDVNCDTPPAQNILAGGFADYTFNCTMGNTAKTTTLTLGGSSSDSTIIQQFKSTLSLLIQPLPNFVYVGGSLDPKAYQPGLNVSFKVQVTQNVAGAAKAFLDTAGTCIAFEGFGPACLKAPVVVNPGATALLEFETKPLPSLGGATVKKFTPSLTIAGMDDNTMAFSATPSITDQFRLDAGVPLVSSTITPPASQVDGESPAITDGAALSFSGSIKDTDENGNQVNCGPPSCTIVSAELHQFSEITCGTDLNDDKAVTPSSGGGILGGSFSGAYNTNAKGVQLWLTVKDDAGNTSPDNKSNCVEVDNLLPTITSAKTAIDTVTNKRTSLRVTFNKPLAGTCNIGDWKVDNNVVVSCTAEPSAPTRVTGVTLGVATELPQDPPLPNLRYEPRTPTGGDGPRFKDRVAHNLADKLLGIADGIVPPLPSIDKLSTGTPKREYAAQDGAFYTNLDAAEVTLLNVKVGGYRGEIWKETGLQEGLQMSGANADTKIGQATRACDYNPEQNPGPACKDIEALKAPVDMTSFTLASADNQDPRVKVYAVVVDPGNNASAVFETVFVRDKFLPTVMNVEAQASRIAVNFAEPVARGQNVPFDFIVRMNDTEEGTVINVQTITGSGNVRNLEVNDGSYNKDGLRSVAYAYTGMADQRYEDRAGNQLADFTAVPSPPPGSGAPPLIVS